MTIDPCVIATQAWTLRTTLLDLGRSEVKVDREGRLDPDEETRINRRLRRFGVRVRREPDGSLPFAHEGLWCVPFDGAECIECRRPIRRQSVLTDDGPMHSDCYMRRDR